MFRGERKASATNNCHTFVLFQQTFGERNRVFGIQTFSHVRYARIEVSMNILPRKRMKMKAFASEMGERRENCN